MSGKLQAELYTSMSLKILLQCVGNTFFKKHDNFFRIRLGAVRYDIGNIVGDPHDIKCNDLSQFFGDLIMVGIFNDFNEQIAHMNDIEVSDIVLPLILSQMSEIILMFIDENSNVH